MYWHGCPINGATTTPPHPLIVVRQKGTIACIKPSNQCPAPPTNAHWLPRTSAVVSSPLVSSPLLVIASHPLRPYCTM
jgi:hypothetical protein